MADNGGIGFFLHQTRASFFGMINILAYSITSFYFLQNQPFQPRSHEALFGFLLPVILDLHKLQCQGKKSCSFETHPKSMWVSVTSLFLYCLLSYAESGRIRINPGLTRVLSHYKELVAWLCLVSLASVLLPDPVSVVLYFLYVLVFAGKNFCCRVETQRRNRGAMLPL
ncbi:hypothetical protein NMG60_11030069 [Bertholletia excelsa]